MIEFKLPVNFFLDRQLSIIGSPRPTLLDNFNPKNIKIPKSIVLCSIESRI
jgi:hypothetical protein